MPSSSSSDCRGMVSLAVALFGVCLSYAEAFLYIVKTLWISCRLVVKRRNIPRVSSAPIEAWAEPPTILPNCCNSSNYHNSPNSNCHNSNCDNNKIIWAFWDRGEARMPGFCKMAVESWRVRHPDWTIIILSDETFRSYVSPSEITSTFFSLKPQYRSDLIRVAVLRRYGGIYLDASYTLYRSFDDLWDEAKRNNDLYLTTLVALKDGVHLPNNCLLVCPNPQNPLLIAWQKLLLQYLEMPLTTTNVAESCRHPSFQRVGHHFHDHSLGSYQLVIGYSGVLWTLADVLFYEPSVREYVKHHVYILPSYRWTYDIVMVMGIYMPEEELLTGFSNDVSLLSWIQRGSTGVRFNQRDEPKVAERLLSCICAMKTSSDFCHNFDKPEEFHVSRGSTLSRIYQASLDTKLLPIQQADRIGAQLVIPKTTQLASTSY